MSTRAMLTFSDRTPFDGEPGGWIYRHSDGYPKRDTGVLADMDRFFGDVEEQCEGTMYGKRFDHPCYLAAKYVAWQAARNAETAARFDSSRDGPRPLDFGSLGISPEPHRDVEWLYWIQCGAKSRGPGARPVVWVSRAEEPHRWYQGREFEALNAEDITHTCESCGQDIPA